MPTELTPEQIEEANKLENQVYDDSRDTGFSMDEAGLKATEAVLRYSAELHAEEIKRLTEANAVLANTGVSLAQEVEHLTAALAASERRVKIYEQCIDRQLAGIQDDPDREEPYRTMDAGGRVQLYCLKGTVERLLSSPQPAPKEPNHD